MGTDLEQRISDIRKFNRGFAKKIGLLQFGQLNRPYTLTEARILFEIGTHHQITASNLSELLGLNAGHLSRILSRLEKQKLIEKNRSEDDGRQRFLHLTAEGQDVFDLINNRADTKVLQMLDSLSEEEQKKLLRAMQVIEKLLLENSQEKPTLILRPHEPGDLGWIVYRHGVLYAEEHGWNEEFEALVAKICAEFLSNYNPKKERCWMAELDAELVGSILLAQSEEKEVAKLRVFFVEPKARGQGIGKRLVEECIKFAKRTGYRKIALRTYSNLTSARQIYEKAGFQLVSEQKRNDFGQELTGQNWELEL